MAQRPPEIETGNPGEGAEGGDAACWAHLVCPECGAIEAGGHREPCHLRAGRVDVVRVYEDPGRLHDERRVLVDRLWPRGLTKATVACDLWLREVAPSTELRRWFGHDPERFEEFSRRYRAELSANVAASALEELRAELVVSPLVLLTATRDVPHSAASVLQSLLAGLPPSTSRRPRCDSNARHTV